MLKQSSGKKSTECNQAKVDECVKNNKYCNITTGNCVLPKGVTTMVNKYPDDIIADPTIGVVGQKQAVNNVKKFLRTLPIEEQAGIQLGPSVTGVKPIAKAAISSKAEQIKVKVVKVPYVGPEQKEVVKKSKSQNSDEECRKQGKLYNKETGNCIQDTSANRKKLGLDKIVVEKVVMEKLVEKPQTYSEMTVVKLRELLKQRSLLSGGVKVDLVTRLIANDKKMAGDALQEPEEEEVEINVEPEEEEVEINVEQYEEEEVPSAPESEEEEVQIEISEEEEEDGLPLINIRKVVDYEEESEPEELEEYELEVGDEYAELLRAQKYMQELVKAKQEEIKKSKLSASEKYAKNIEKKGQQLLLKREAEKEARKYVKSLPELSEGKKPFLLKKLAQEEQAKKLVKDFIDKGCRKTGCEKEQVCNVDTGKCINPENAIVKNYYMLTFNGSVYYGSKQALISFAQEMGIEDPYIQVATKTKMNTVIAGEKLKQSDIFMPQPVADKPDYYDIVKEEEKLVISEEENPEDIANILTEVSVEKPLSLEEKELIDKIRMCIGV